MFVLHYNVGYFDDGGIETLEFDTIDEVENKIQEVLKEFDDAELKDFNVYYGTKMTVKVAKFIEKIVVVD